MTGRRALIALAALLALPAPVPAAALELPPGAVRAGQRIEPLATYRLATGPWSPEGLPAVPAEGQVRLEAWRIEGAASTLDLIRPLRDQLAADGYDILFECQADACGGFDFRYESDLLPEPEMHVNLADFHYLCVGRPGEDGIEYLALVASRSGATGYLHVTRITPAAGAAVAATDVAALASKSPAATAGPGGGQDGGQDGGPDESAPLIGALTSAGRAVLDGVAFETGSSRLADGPFPALDTLAAWLRNTPDARVTLVGHTDAEGALPPNIALSRSRAEAVARHLVRVLGVPAAQVDADGVGYLMPLAPNTTEEGRTANRRVEVVLTSTR